jgi:hypothetical protein
VPQRNMQAGSVTRTVSGLSQWCQSEE